MSRVRARARSRTAAASSSYLADADYRTAGMDTVGDLGRAAVQFAGRCRTASWSRGGPAWASFEFTFAGWLLAPFVVAGLPGVFKPD
jgi:hypothetical protein